MLILSTIATYFIMMNLTMASVAAFINIMGGIYTYRTCLIIYNRFKLIGGSDSKLNYSNKDDNHELNDGDDDEYEDYNDENDSKNERLVKAVRKNSGGSFFGKMFNFGNKAKRNSFSGDRYRNGASENDIEGFEKVSKISKKVRVKGFMSMKKDDRSRSSWKRYYFVMVRSNLYYYKNQADWEYNRVNPIKSRPIDLTGYIVSGMSVEPPYQISLSPSDADDIRRIWEFRIDTVHEMDAWIRAFDVASGTGFQVKHPGAVDVNEMISSDRTGEDDSDSGSAWTSSDRRSNRGPSENHGFGSDTVVDNFNSSTGSFYDVGTENSEVSFQNFDK